MDFWLGHWEVTFTSDGKKTAGTNTISKHAGRIFELFTAPGGATWTIAHKRLGPAQ
jgi:hypothetical protein